MCGQVKHAKIFSSIAADWRLLKLLATLPSKNTDGLIGGVIKILEDEGIHLRDSTMLLKPLLAASGVMTRRQPEKDELTDIAYGRRVANALAGFDVGQSVAICERACVAVEAMEGTDATIERAGMLMKSLEEEDGSPASTLARRLTVVKVAKPNQDMRFDVPVIGVKTVETMIEAGATCLSVEAGRTLLFDRETLLKRAAEAGIAVVGRSRE